MSEEKLMDNKNSFIVDDAYDALRIFALIIAKTQDGGTVVRPIGGKYGQGINDAVSELDKLYPDCKMKLLSEDCCFAKDCFLPNGIALERLL